MNEFSTAKVKGFSDVSTTLLNCLIISSGSKSSKNSLGNERCGYPARFGTRKQNVEVGEKSLENRAKLL